MKEFKTLVPELREKVVILHLNRPDSLNALNSTMFDELDEFFTADYQDYQANCVIITGKGEKAFAAGADIKELHGLSSSQAETLSRKGQIIFSKIENFHMPVIGAINGFALGGGCELAMACHIRIASSKAKFGQPEVSLGIIPGYGGTQRLIQLIGKGKATELLLTGDMINAEEAYRLDLVNYVTEPEQLMERAFEIAAKLQTRGPLALAGIISTVNQYFSSSQEGFLFEAKTFGDVASTQDFAEGTSAFIEKRKPLFQGK
ncbi:MAG TPA: enoyl-CoA hydratase-related protein [Saprospiraceae bacterium]|nr:enoyl-CoA hydratase-related protein [Saprospiraceae bacterium]